MTTAILIGPPGAGKSTVGPLLAALLGVAFLDTDSVIEAAAGKPVGDIFIQDGEATFRALERTAVAEAVEGYQGVLALGGGAVRDPGTQRLLAGQRVVVGKDACSVVVIHRGGVGEITRPACRVLTDAGYLVHAEEVPEGEAAKDIGVATRLWSRLAAHRMTRSDAIVGVGGGATTDLAGFVAASWLRRVRLVLGPHTRLAVTR